MSTRRYIVAPQRKLIPLDLLVDLPLRHSQERPWHAFRNRRPQKWFNPLKIRVLNPPYCSNAGMIAGVANAVGEWHGIASAGQMCCEG